MHCSISGELPEEVVSKKSGLFFEKRLIERFISDHGKCPVTEEPLTVDGIVPVKTGKEWDGLMLSNYALEQQLHSARQELSHALYQYDAACRDIARLKKERDDSRALLAQAEKRIPMSVEVPDTVNAVSINNGKRASQDDELGPNAKRICPGISSSIISELADCNTLLSQQRKKRQIPSTLAPAEVMERYTQITVNPLHKTNKPGILSLDIHISKDIIATAGADSNALVFDRPSGQVVSTLSGHSKKVTSVKFVGDGDLVVTGSAIR